MDMHLEPAIPLPTPSRSSNCGAGRSVRHPEAEPGIQSVFIEELASAGSDARKAGALDSGFRFAAPE
jgi:hypothetical protein